MIETFTQLASLVILFMIFITGTLVLMAGLILVCVETCCFCWRRIFRRGKVYRRAN